LLPTDSNKLLAQWQGPYHVLRRVGAVNYEVYMPDKRKRKVMYYINMLKKWYPPETKCFWMADDVDSDGVPAWRGQSGKLPIIGTQLSEQQKRQLWQLLSEFKLVMSGKCGRTSTCQHHIHTKGGLPVRQ